MVKTYKHLYPKITNFENLYRAHRQARRGGKRKQPEVAAFESASHSLPAPVPLRVGFALLGAVLA
jgi:hypothetical protein